MASSYRVLWAGVWRHGALTHRMQLWRWHADGTGYCQTVCRWGVGTPPPRLLKPPRLQVAPLTCLACINNEGYHEEVVP